LNGAILAHVDKSLARRALTKKHLRGIGIVAAEWANLELVMQLAIHSFAELPPDISFALTKSGSLTGWCDTLILLAHIVPKHAHKEIPLRKLAKHLQDLQADRANVVHSSWTLLMRANARGNLVAVKKPGVARGIGAPKKGRKSATLDIEMTATEMEAIADKILKAKETLMEIISLPPPLHDK
jgi:hypothetical protein